MEDDNVVAHIIPENGVWPNNEKLPLIVYKGVLDISDNGRTVVKTMSANGWGNIWRGGLYDYHHYHSQAHEALGVYSGSATVQFGGEGGIKLEVTAGDMVIIPAGVAHRLITSDNFAVAGAYPPGQYPDMKYGDLNERPKADHDISRVAAPKTDPAFGTGGSLLKLWHVE